VLAGRYRVLDRLGSGGMATVFLCEDERLGRKVAVKRLHAESPRDTAQRFQREAKIGASLNHPNVVSIFDAVSDDESVLIVMEYVDGPNLAKLVQREGALEPEQALEILRGTAAALDHAHAEGVVHRDVKPANILIGSDGEAKLADLGIATALEGTRITHSGAVLGTVSYMSPEQVDGGEPTALCDVYSLSVVAFEILSGHKARVGRTPVEIARRIVSEEPPLLSDVWPEAAPEAVDVIRRGMARTPDARPRSAGELVDELERALEPTLAAERPSPTLATAALPDTATADPPVTPPARRPAGTGAARSRQRPGWLVPAALIAALALLLAGGVALLSSGDDGGSPEESGEVAGGSESGQNAPGQGSAAEEPGSGGDSSAPGAGTPPAPRSGEPAGSPEEAVQGLYQRAANGDFEGAWALAGPGVRSQLGGYDAFVATLDSLESIEFTKLKPKRPKDGTARVDIETVATHTDRVDRCKGKADMVEQGSGWVVEHLDVSC
jgi:eukaryotic-like serine/threonine-protein kinase